MDSPKAFLLALLSHFCVACGNRSHRRALTHIGVDFFALPFTEDSIISLEFCSISKASGKGAHIDHKEIDGCRITALGRQAFPALMDNKYS